MQYMLLIYSTEGDGPDDPSMIDRYAVFGQEVRDAGKFVAAGRLRPTSTASSVRVRDGQLEVTDGPFAETKEQLGGYYLLECDDLDEAIAYARKIPASEHGSIEVRPIWEVPVRA
jgi:hypothetical protein